MKSVRLNQDLERRLEEAARITGKPVSQIIRDAVQARCDELLSKRLDRRLADVIGAVASNGGDSSETGKAFTEIVKKPRSRKCDDPR